MFHRKRIVEGKEKSLGELEKLIKAEFAENKGRYGVRRITASLRSKGILINHKVVQKIMRKLGLKGKRPKKIRQYSSYLGTVGKVAENLLKRHFDVKVPNKVFVTDVTEFNLGSIGKVYLSPVMDLCNREIIGYDIARHPDFAQTRRMMENAFKDRKIAEGALFHSDQGWQYQMKEFGDMLSDLGITQSMSRKGNCHDNSVMENFFGRLKVEMFYGEEDTFTSYEDFKRRLEEYIDWYNRSRIKEYLHWKSPYQVLSNSVTL
jgi:transposase InsO family protein